MDPRNESSVDPAKKIYSTPELTTYCSIDELTEATSGAVTDGARSGSK